MTLVSVVVPVRNRAEPIAACIEALLAQTYRQLEIIVVDNDSSDETRDVVRRYPVKLAEERAIRTSYAARNCGIDYARGEIVAFIDSDCIAEPHWIGELIAPFADERCGAAVGTIHDAPSRTLCEEYSSRIDPFARPTHGGLRTLLTANAAVRRSTLIRVGFFDERLPTAGDVDLGWRIQMQLGLSIVDAPAAVVSHVHRSTFRGVFRQYARYGLSEILLTTLYRGAAGSRPPKRQLPQMARQLRACVTYVLGFAWRFMSGPFDRRRFLWPLFLLTVETGNLAGKVGGLWSTRFHRRNPYPNDRPIIR